VNSGRVHQTYIPAKPAQDVHDPMLGSHVQILASKEQHINKRPGKHMGKTRLKMSKRNSKQIHNKQIAPSLRMMTISAE
jgi:hypothetical protein